MEAMNAGVPLVVIPQMYEQELTANRVDELGLGVYLPKEEVTVSSLQEAVQAVSSDQELLSRVKNMQKDVKEAGGAERAAAEIEAFMKNPLSRSKHKTEINLISVFCLNIFSSRISGIL